MFDVDSYGSICFIVLLIYIEEYYLGKKQEKSYLVKNLRAGIFSQNLSIHIILVTIQ